jgi:hypothetical protein
MLWNGYPTIPVKSTRFVATNAGFASLFIIAVAVKTLAQLSG